MRESKELAFFTPIHVVEAWLDLIEPDFDDYYEVYLVRPLLDAFQGYYGTEFVVGFPLKLSSHHLVTQRTGDHIDITQFSSLLNFHREEDTSTDLFFGPIKEFRDRKIDSISCQLKRYGKNHGDVRSESGLFEKITLWESEYADAKLLHLVVLIEGFAADLNVLSIFCPRLFQRVVFLKETPTGFSGCIANNPDYIKQ